MDRQKILEEASNIVCKGREKEYGSPENNFEIISKLWSIYLDKTILPKDVGIMMSLLKIARIKSGNYKNDNYIDAIGYMAISGELDNK